MSPEQAIRAGQLAQQRERVRELFRSGHAVRVASLASGSVPADVALDTDCTRAALNAIDALMSERLQRLGVSE